MRLVKKKYRQKSGFWLKSGVGFLFFLLVIFSGIKFFRMNNNSLYDTKNNFNLALEDQQNLYVISFHQQSGLLNILQIPGNIYVPMAKGFGEYPLSSVWGLGEMEPYGGGWLLQLSAQNFLNVPISGWAKVNSQNQNKVTKKTVTNWLVGLLRHNQSNLTRFDILRLLWLVNGLKTSQIIVYQLDQTQASEAVDLPDGSTAYRVQEEYLQKLAKELFSDAQFSADGIVWAVLDNYSQYNSLAVKAAKIIHNIGGEAIPIFARDDKAGGIYCDQEEICNSYSAKLLAKTFNLPIKKQELNESRGEALIVLDQNFWEFFYKR